MEIEIGELGNGLKIVHQRADSPVAHCGVMLNVGSRDESEEEHGIAHFIEHALFKGTKKRKAYHVLSRLDSVGGELNAYTAKEETSIYASFPRQYLSRAVELLADIILRSSFPEKELDREREVIMDEIDAYLDDPAEQIFDDFEDLLFHGHPIGRGILGTKESLAEISRQQIIRFVDKHYQPRNMVFSSIGRFSLHQIMGLLKKHFDAFRGDYLSVHRQPFRPNGMFQKNVERNLYQAHCVIGCRGYDLFDEKRKALAVLNNLLAGPPMNTRLGMELREKRGFTYTIESNYSPYTDTGCFSVYFGTSPKNLKKAQDVIFREFDRLGKKSLSGLQMSMAKKQLAGQLIMSRENPNAIMLSNAKSLLHYGQVDTLEETLAKLYRVTANELQEVALEVLDPAQQSMLTFTPGGL